MTGSMDCLSAGLGDSLTVVNLLSDNLTNYGGSASTSSYAGISRQPSDSNSSSVVSSPGTTSFFHIFGRANVTDQDTKHLPTTNDIEIDLDQRPYSLSYFYGILPLIFFCIVSAAINIKILMSVRWIRRPLSPTLHISLSLAGADAFSSVALAIGLVMNSFVPHGLGIQLRGLGCFLLGLEAVRLGAVIITMGHLVALAINHYLGILRPLHYLSIMTHRITMLLTILLWTLPLSFFLAYFSLIDGEGFQSQHCETNTFLLKKKFRIMFSSLFFGPLVLMVCIYAHIFRIVRKHQASRLRFSRAGSSFQRSGGSSSARQEHTASQQMARNVKAINTTLFILGSFVIGWMPATFLYVLVCEDCLLKFDWITGDSKFLVYNASNCLIILKTMVNPIIYAARMHEIQKQLATRRMHSSLCGFFETSNYSEERNRLGHSSDGPTSRRGSLSRTAICKVAVNNVGNKSPRSDNYKYTYTGMKGYSCGTTVV